MFHHLLHLPFVILHFVAVVLLIMGAAFLLRRFAWRRCGVEGASGSADRTPENSAFEDYRRATIARLEKEAEEFRMYLERLRRAADASAFQAFLEHRKNSGSSVT
ncbi:DUF2852 domain-containing protein [Hyphomicrobium sp.]|uniref:DUF2852 domain-containing protein n=1 Tax=Hyphomicrobium sp. TaxID=82 RepID=UPI000F9FA7AC|nr:DUF2852 domain-containing protein [Hyphomicrobium sp.]RUP08733.1 MAG: DUF2852 domain-containing protein [Hyphomicrobium sp.]